MAYQQMSYTCSRCGDETLEPYIISNPLYAYLCPHCYIKVLDEMERAREEESRYPLKVDAVRAFRVYQAKK